MDGNEATDSQSSDLETASLLASCEVTSRLLADCLRVSHMWLDSTSHETASYNQEVTDHSQSRLSFML